MAVKEISINNKIYSYTIEDWDYFLSKDIYIQEWTVDNTITNGYKKSSFYKWDADDNLMFSITDKNNITREIKWHIFRHEYGLPIIRQEEDNIFRIKRFIENAMIFQYEDWEDYDNAFFLLKVKDILESEGPRHLKRKQIEKLVNTKIL